MSDLMKVVIFMLVMEFVTFVSIAAISIMSEVEHQNNEAQTLSEAQTK